MTVTFANDFYPAFPFVWIGFAFYIGVMAAGGFSCLNYRLPIKAGAIFTEKMRAIAQMPSPPSIWSVCDSCHKPLGWRGVLPIIGYMATKGRCPDCGAKVPLIYPVMEFLTGMIAVAALLFTMHPALVVVALWLVMIGWLDHDTTWIPDGFTFPLAIAALPAAWLGWIPLSVTSVLLGCVVGGAIMFVSQYFQFRIRGDDEPMKSVPLGDVTLLAALGAWTGPYSIVIVALISAFLMIGYIPIASRHDADDGGYPYGPALCAAGLLAIIFESATGQPVWDAFMSFVS